MKYTRFLLAAILGLSLTHIQAQDLQKIEKEKEKLGMFEEEKFSTELSKKYAGQVVFSNSEIEREDPESKYITMYTLGDKLYIRGYYANSVCNSLLIQLLESGKKAKDLKEMKSGLESQTRLLYNLYLDGTGISTIGRVTEIGKEAYSILSFRNTLNDGTGDFFEGEKMYRELLKHEELLTPGKHKLRIEEVPMKTFSTGSDFKFKPIAVGEIDLIVPTEMNLNESDCFPKKGMTDTKLENEVIQACKNYFKNGGAYIIKAILYDKNVTVIKNQYTGAIIKKSFMAAVINKNGDEVWYDYYIFDKVYDGRSYENAIISTDMTLNGYAAPAGQKVNKGCLKFLK